MVFAAPEGQTLKASANAAAVDATLKEASGAAAVSNVSPLTLSQDATIGYADVIYPTPSREICEEAKQELADIASWARTPAYSSSSPAASRPSTAPSRSA